MTKEKFALALHEKGIHINSFKLVPAETPFRLYGQLILEHNGKTKYVSMLCKDEDDFFEAGNSVLITIYRSFGLARDYGL